MTTILINNLRRRAAKLGWSFHKSNGRKDTIENRGQYQLVQGVRKAGTVVASDHNDAPLDAVAHFIEREERRLA